MRCGGGDTAPLPRSALLGSRHEALGGRESTKGSTEAGLHPRHPPRRGNKTPNPPSGATEPAVDVGGAALGGGTGCGLGVEARLSPSPSAPGSWGGNKKTQKPHFEDEGGVGGGRAPS